MTADCMTTNQKTYNVDTANAITVIQNLLTQITMIAKINVNQEKNEINISF